jgi:hypothetical protein
VELSVILAEAIGLKRTLKYTRYVKLIRKHLLTALLLLLSKAKTMFLQKELFTVFTCFGLLLSSPFIEKSNAITTLNFGYTGAQQTWTVPATGSYTIETWGAQGGNAGYNGTISTYGGKGGYATGAISLAANQVIYIYVGGQGVGGIGILNSNQQAGGFNGGGFGYNGGNSASRGAGGGGATDVRVGGTALSNRVIVAGAGAGGVTFATYGTNYPGAGGGAAGSSGCTSDFCPGPWHGSGGTQVGGGGGGSNGSGGGSGSAGKGGDAGFAYSYGESGGGSGYWGGGASGSGMAGGGGSGYVGGVTSSTNTAGTASMPNPDGGTMTGRSGNGYLRITYAPAPDTTPPTFTSSSTFSAAENIATSATAATIRVSESATVTISSGADAARFNISRSETNTAIIKFNASPNYEAPTDVGGNNVYEITLTATDAAANAGTQSITITVTDVVDTSSFNSLALAGSATTATYRTAVVITANITVASRVTFRVNGKVLPGCKNRLSSGSGSSFSVTCSWRPSNRGQVSLTAAAAPTGAGITGATAAPVSIMVERRTGAR